MDRHALIMAGGGGTRFWPLSRQNSPKQLLNLSGNDVMINETVKRVQGFVPNNHIHIITNATQVKSLSDVLVKDLSIDNIIVEPVQRNTGACILYSAMVLKKKYGDGIMCIFPSDHYITNQKAFLEVIERGISFAANTESLITIGIKPTFAATGYGYIKYCEKELGRSAYLVEEFVEKPVYEVAVQYLKSGNYLWNSGMFIWKVSVILENFKRFLPRLYAVLSQIFDYIGTEKEMEAIGQVYPELQSISIDYGIMERSDNVFVVPGDFGWNDVGSWDALGSVFAPDQDGNIVRAGHIGINTKNSIIYGCDRLIATVGVDGMIIVDTEDAILICPKNKAQDVKKIVEQLKIDKKDYLL